MILLEHTDTSCGEANYCWCNRYYCVSDLTDRQLVRLAKRVTGFSGVRARVENFGDEIRIYPSGYSQVIMVFRFDNLAQAQGKQIDAKGEEVIDRCSNGLTDYS
jgi:hypothetical protein